MKKKTMWECEGEKERDPGIKRWNQKEIHQSKKDAWKFHSEIGKTMFRVSLRRWCINKPKSEKKMRIERKMIARDVPKISDSWSPFALTSWTSMKPIAISSCLYCVRVCVEEKGVSRLYQSQSCLNIHSQTSQCWRTHD